VKKSVFHYSRILFAPRTIHLLSTG